MQVKVCAVDHGNEHIVREPDKSFVALLPFSPLLVTRTMTVSAPLRELRGGLRHAACTLTRSRNERWSPKRTPAVAMIKVHKAGAPHSGQRAAGDGPASG